MGPAPTVGRAKPRHNYLRSRQIHDGLMPPAFGVTPADIDQDPIHPSNGREGIDVPVPFLSLPEMACKPMSQSLFGAAGVDVIAGRKDLPAQGSDPDLNSPR